MYQFHMTCHISDGKGKGERYSMNTLSIWKLLLHVQLVDEEFDSETKSSLKFIPMSVWARKIVYIRCCGERKVRKRVILIILRIMFFIYFFRKIYGEEGARQFV